MEPFGRRHRLRPMTPTITLRRPLAGTLLALALVTAACGSSSATTTPPGPSDGAPSLPVVMEPTRVPGATGGEPGGGTGGGSQPGDPGGVPVPVDPGVGGVNPGNPGNPGNPEPTIVTPVAGVTGVHGVSAVKLEASVSGSNVAARVAWWSGVEPCYVLAGVKVAQEGRTITLTVTEGSAAAADTMCIELGVYKATIVDLGELEPGTWTIAADGEAPPVEVTVAG